MKFKKTLTILLIILSLLAAVTACAKTPQKVEPQAVSISVTAPAKDAYFAGDTQLDLTGGKIRVNYDDGTYADVTMSADTGAEFIFDFSAAGASVPVTVRYLGFTAGFTVAVSAVAMTSIEILTAPAKKTYVVGSTALDITGGKIKANYNNGSSASVDMSLTDTGFEFIYDFSETGGAIPVTVKYRGFEAEFMVAVVEPGPVDAELLQAPLKNTYLYGQTALDVSGGTVRIIYNNGNHTDIGLDVINAEYEFDFRVIGATGVTFCLSDFPGLPELSFSVSVGPDWDYFDYLFGAIEVRTAESGPYLADKVAAVYYFIPLFEQMTAIYFDEKQAYIDEFDSRYGYEYLELMNLSPINSVNWTDEKFRDLLAIFYGIRFAVINGLDYEFAEIERFFEIFTADLDYYINQFDTALGYWTNTFNAIRTYILEPYYSQWLDGDDELYFVHTMFAVAWDYHISGWDIFLFGDGDTALGAYLWLADTSAVDALISAGDPILGRFPEIKALVLAQDPRREYLALRSFYTNLSSFAYRISQQPELFTLALSNYCVMLNTIDEIYASGDEVLISLYENYHAAGEYSYKEAFEYYTNYWGSSAMAGDGEVFLGEGMREFLLEYSAIYKKMYRDGKSDDRENYWLLEDLSDEFIADAQRLLSMFEALTDEQKAAFYRCVTDNEYFVICIVSNYYYHNDFLSYYNKYSQSERLSIVSDLFLAEACYLNYTVYGAQEGWDGFVTAALNVWEIYFYLDADGKATFRSSLGEFYDRVLGLYFGAADAFPPELEEPALLIARAEDFRGRYDTRFFGYYFAACDWIESVYDGGDAALIAAYEASLKAVFDRLTDSLYAPSGIYTLYPELLSQSAQSFLKAYSAFMRPFDFSDEASRVQPYLSGPGFGAELEEIFLMYTSLPGEERLALLMGVNDAIYLSYIYRVYHSFARGFSGYSGEFFHDALIAERAWLNYLYNGVIGQYGLWTFIERMYWVAEVDKIDVTNVDYLLFPCVADWIGRYISLYEDYEYLQELAELYDIAQHDNVVSMAIIEAPDHSLYNLGDTELDLSGMRLTLGLYDGMFGIVFTEIYDLETVLEVFDFSFAFDPPEYVDPNDPQGVRVRVYVTATSKFFEDRKFEFFFHVRFRAAPDDRLLNVLNTYNIVEVTINITQPDKLEYYVGEDTIDLSGAELRFLNRPNGAPDFARQPVGDFGIDVVYTVFDFTFDFSFDSPGLSKVTVTITAKHDSSITYTFNFYVTVVEVPLTEEARQLKNILDTRNVVSVSFEANPGKLEYYVGDDTIDVSGARIRFSLESPEHPVFDINTVSEVFDLAFDFDFTGSGRTRVFITITAKHDSSITYDMAFYVTVIEATSDDVQQLLDILDTCSLAAVTFSTLPDKLEYYAGEDVIDLSGAAITLSVREDEGSAPVQLDFDLDVLYEVFDFAFVFDFSEPGRTKVLLTITAKHDSSITYTFSYDVSVVSAP